MSAHGPHRAKANPFVREGHVDKPSIVGSHWWNEELAQASKLQSRRSVIAVLAAGAGVLALGAVAIGLSGDDTREELRRSIDLQRDLGWNFGATSETVAFDALFTTAYAREALPRLQTDLLPSAEAHRKYHVSTLFAAPEALPRLPLSGGETPLRLADALRPINTPSMQRAEAAGRSLADLLSQVTGGQVALVVDLDGPDAVAFAAGAADHFDPVFLFDNWPHPRGVVPAHLTLAAAVFHQPRFAAAAASRPPNAPPLFVLDRKRLSAYADEGEQFDNRWLAKLPVPADLTALEVKRVLYVVAVDTIPIELRDAGRALHDWKVASFDVRALAAEAFEPDAQGKLWLGGTPTNHLLFWASYRWKPPAPESPRAPGGARGPGGARAPAAPTPPPPEVPFPRNAVAAAWSPAAQPVDPTDSQVGMTRVEVDLSTGHVNGIRSGSWNRASGGWGG